MSGFVLDAYESDSNGVHAPDCPCVVCDHYRYTEPALWYLLRPIEGVRYGLRGLQLDRLRVLSLEAPEESHN